MFKTLLRKLGALVPRTDGPGGVPTETQGGVPAFNAEDDATALNRAAELEAANRRVLELEAKESQFDSRVHEEAERLLHEVMPDLGSQLNAPAPHPYEQQRNPEYFRGQGQQTQGSDDEELTPEEQIARDVQVTRMELNQLRMERDSDRVTSSLDQLQRDYPHMDRFRVQAFMATQARPETINLRKLAEISHKKELSAKQAYAEQWHAQQMQSISAGPAPPPGIPRGAGTPNEGVKITRENASQIFRERLEARGFSKR